MARGLRNPFISSALRQVRSTLPRFLSILLITLIGVMFFTGLRLTGPYMKSSAELWFDNRNFMDIQVISTMGLDADDIAAIRSTPGVMQVSPGYTANLLVKRDGLETSIQLLSLDTSSESPINTPELLRGRLPEKDNECLAEESWLRSSGNDLGSKVRFYSGTSKPLSDTVKYDSFTIVGVIKSPLFIAADRGNSDVGQGRNRYYFYTLPGAFSLEFYAAAYLQVDLAGQIGDSPLMSNGDIRGLSPICPDERRGGVSRFTDAYFDAVAPTLDALKDTGRTRSTKRFNSIISDARLELTDARAEVTEGYQELTDAEQELADALVELEEGWAELVDARSTLDRGWTELYSSRPRLDSGWAELDAARAELDSGWAELAPARAELDDGWNTYNQELAQLEAAYAAGYVSEFEYQAALQQLELARQQLLAGESQYEAGYAKLAAGEEGYQSGRAELQEGEAAYQSGRNQLLNGEASYNEGLAEYQDGRASYEEGLATFEEEKADALADLAQAEADIAQAEADLDALEPPRWYVLNIESNPGFRSYLQQGGQMEDLAVVIPLLFFLIAALVSMTSVTRLVDSDRTIIGTYKALGYTNRSITARYLIYAFSATFIGGIAGVLLGANLFPSLIFNAFRTLYSIPPGPMYFSWSLTILALSFAVVSTVGPAILICLGILRETPASAMRPLAPRPGKRIFLERIKPLWSSLSFLHKITARNLLRYKKRAFMTIFGVAGCTALVFTGFALNDSLGTIGPKQYGDIEAFDVSITFKPDAESEELESFFAFVAESPELSSFTLVKRETVDIISENITKDLSLIVAEDPVSFGDYYQMRTRGNGPLSPSEPLIIEDRDVIITEQLARQIGVDVGDTITLRTLNDEEADFIVSGVRENYVYHYVFMTPESYEQHFKKDFKPNQILGMLNEGYESMPESLTTLAAVTGVSYTQKQADDFGDITDVLGFVMVILILSAAALLFVVLFSLNTINREERTRELASIKVLGFFDRELASYIYREGFILTILGIVLGIIEGIALQRYIISTIEVDVFMFSRDLLLSSYLYSILLTAVFALIVNLLLYRPLTQIDMVSSLKAIE